MCGGGEQLKGKKMADKSLFSLFVLCQGFSYCSRYPSDFKVLGTVLLVANGMVMEKKQMED